MFNSIDTPHKKRTALIMGGSMAGLWGILRQSTHFLHRFFILSTQFSVIIRVIKARQTD